MHLFWAICILFDCRLFSKGYHAAQAWSKCGWIKALHSKRRKESDRNFLFTVEKFESVVYCV